MRVIVVMLMLITVLGPINAQRERPPRPDAYNVAYGDAYQRQKLDIYLPSDGENVPVVLMIHGGGYFAGNKSTMAPLADFLRSEGLAVVVPNYRLAPFDPYPAPIQDLACALAWIYAHADDYSFNADHVTVLGESAGGNAALLLGAQDDLSIYLDECDYPVPETQVENVVAYFPIVDLSSCFGRPVCAGAETAMALYLDVTNYTPDLLGAANPLTHLDTDDPPVLLIHGTADVVVPFSESELYADALAALDIPHELAPIPGANHAFAYRLDLDEGVEAANIVVDWLANFAE